MNEKFYCDEELLAEITDSLLIVYKGAQEYQYKLNSLTGALPIFSHESEPKYVVVFGIEGGSGQTIGVVWTKKAKAKEFRDAVTNAVT